MVTNACVYCKCCEKIDKITHKKRTTKIYMICDSLRSQVVRDEFTISDKDYKV